MIEMSKLKRLRLISPGALWLSVPTLFALGCGNVTPDDDSSPGDTPGTSPTPGVDSGECTKIKDFQDPAKGVTLGTMIKVCDAIVTGVTYKGTIFIGDAEGGAYSGIFVFQPDGATYIPSDIAVGDKVDVVGEFATYFGANQLALYDEKIPPVSVTIKSKGNDLPPAVVISDPSTIATPCDSATSGLDGSKYEGVRVSLSNVTVTNLDPCEQGSFGVFEVNNSLFIDDDNGMNYAAVQDETLTSVEGVLHFAFDHFRVFPNPGEVKGTSGGEETPTYPPGTPLPEGSCQAIADLVEKDGDQVNYNSPVRVCDVVVTGKDSKGFFVQDGVGSYTGIYVFDGPKTNLPSIQIGDEVTVSGTLAVYFDANQIALDDSSTVEVTDQGVDLPAPVEIEDPAEIATVCGGSGSGALAYEYEGVRVTVTSVKVTDINPCDQGSFGVFEVDDSLYVDDDLGMNYEPNANDILTSVTGVLHYAFEAYRIFPGEDQVVVGEEGEETPTPDGPTPGEDTVTPSNADCISVKALQNSTLPTHPEVGSNVKVCDVVVTALDGGSRMFVGEPDGGAFSGIQLFGVSGVAPKDVATGDEVTVEGEFKEVFGTFQIDVTGDDASIIRTAKGKALPEPELIDDISTITNACDNTDPVPNAARYEGVRIKVETVKVTDLNPCDNGSFGVFEVDDSLLVDDNFGLDYEPVINDELDSITGIFHLDFEVYRLYPGPGDVKGGTAPEPTPEPTPGPTPDPNATPAPTPEPVECIQISDVQDVAAAAHPDAEAEVVLCEAVVTTVQQFKNSSGQVTSVHFWIQEPSAAPGEFEGIYVFDTKNVKAGVKVGDHVTVSGVYTEFFDLSEIEIDAAADVEIVSSGNPVPPAVVVDPAAIATAYGGSSCAVTSQGPKGEAYESMVVKVEAVTAITVAPTCGDDKADFEVDDQLWVDDVLYTFTLTKDAKYDLTGILNYRFSHFRLLPRSVDDVAGLK